jgi:hypothetical protein
MFTKFRPSDLVPGVSSPNASPTLTLRPVFGPNGQCVAAISIPFLAEGGAAREITLRDAVAAAAKSLTWQIGGIEWSPARGTK